MTTISKWCLQATIKMQEKKIPGYATHGPLNDSTLRTRPHTPDSFNSPNKKKPRSCNFPGGPLVRPPVPAARPRRRWFDLRLSLLVNQSAFAHALPSQAPKAHEASFTRIFQLHSERTRSKPKATRFVSQKKNSLYSHEKALEACPHAFLSPGAPPLRPASFSAPRPFWACLRSLRQSGERTRLLPRQCDRWAFHSCAWRTRCQTFSESFCPQNLLSLSFPSASFWRETAPFLHPSRGGRVHTVS